MTTVLTTALRRLAALVCLLALLVGAPYVLWTWGGPLLPDQVPSLDQARAALSEQDTGAVLMGVLVVIGWIAWAVFAAAVLLEFAVAVASIRGGGRALAAVSRGMRRIPVLGGAQSAASVLVGAVLAGTLLAPAAMASSPAAAADLPVLPHQAAAVSAPAHTAGPQAGHRDAVDAQSLAPAFAAVTAGPVWQVSRGDTLWAIAEKTMGDPLRYSEIVELNRDTPQPDGGRLSSADTWLEVGWTLALPSDAQAPAALAAAAPSSRQATATVTVEAGDTLSALAQEYLGSASAYPELAQANAVTNPDYLDIGQVLLLPAPASLEQSQAGTVPSAPAAQETTTTPDLGGTVDPAAVDAAPVADPASAPIDAAPITPAPQEAQPPVQSATPLSPAANAPVQDVAPTTASPQTPAASAPAAGPAAPLTTAQSASALPPSSAVATESAAPMAAAVDAQDSAPVGLLGGAAGLTLAAVLAGLYARRRRVTRDRRPGYVPVADLSAARVEKSIRDRANGQDPLWVDQCLRVMLATADPAAFPDVIGAVVADNELRVLLAHSLPAPPPFVQDGKHWVLNSAAELPPVGVPTARAAAPLPALATVAVTADRAYLLDLERAQALHVTGPRPMCQQYLTHLAVDLATNLWSDGIELTLVGWGEDLVDIDRTRVTHLPTLSDASALLRTWLQEVADAVAEAGTDATTARGGDHGDFFTPLVLIVDAEHADSAEIQDLQANLNVLAASGRAATAVILTGADTTSDAIEVQLHEDGQVTLGGLWPEIALQAPLMTRHDLAQLVPSLQHPFEQDEPAAPANDPAPWADNMTVLGGLHHRADPALSTDTGIDTPVPADHQTQVDQQPAVVDEQPNSVQDLELTHPSPAGDADPHHDVEENPQSRAAVVDIRPGATLAAHQLARTLAADPDLNADLAAWTGQHPDTRPRVAILGPPVLTSTGTPPRERLPRNTELAVYLALHPRGVTADRMATDLWPEAAVPASGTIRELMSTLRKWLGRDPAANTQYLPAAKGGVYRLPDRLLDSELLRRLHKRAQAKTDAADSSGALADYVQALELVRLDNGGTPLWEYTGQAYSWLHTLDHSDARHMASAIVDVAAETADLALQLGDLQVAQWAADIGHTVDPQSDRPLCQLLLVAHAAGQMDTATRLVGEILQANEALAPEECTQWAQDTISRVFPTGLPRHAVGR